MISVARPSVLRAVRSQLHPSRPIFDVRLSALTRLLSTLAVLEQRGGKLSSASLSAIVAAQKLGGSVTGFVAGDGVKSSAAVEAAKIKGIEKIVAVENAAYEKVCETSTTSYQAGNHHYSYHTTTGLARKLRSVTRGQHQKRRIYTCDRRTFGIWQGPSTSRRGSA